MSWLNRDTHRKSPASSRKQRPTQPAPQPNDVLMRSRGLVNLTDRVGGDVAILEPNARADDDGCRPTLIPDKTRGIDAAELLVHLNPRSEGCLLCEPGLVGLYGRRDSIVARLRQPRASCRELHVPGAARDTSTLGPTLGVRFLFAPPPSEQVDTLPHAAQVVQRSMRALMVVRGWAATHHSAQSAGRAKPSVPAPA
jgi:hypothetical protein